MKKWTLPLVLPVLLFLSFQISLLRFEDDIHTPGEMPSPHAGEGAMDLWTLERLGFLAALSRGVAVRSASPPLETALPTTAPARPTTQVSTTEPVSTTPSTEDSTPGIAQNRHIADALAARGLSPKLYVAGCPECIALLNAMGEASELMADAGELASVYLLLRGVRGTRGVPWAWQYLQSHVQTFRGDPAQFCQDLHAAFAAETLRRGGKHTWAAHLESRHGGLSGVHFLDGLLREDGFRGWREAATGLTPLFAKILAGRVGAPIELPANALLKALKIVEGVVVLAVQTRGNVTKTIRVKDYNAMDFCRGIINWAEHSGRAVVQDLAPSVFQEIKKRQARSPEGKAVTATLEAFGVETAEKFNAYIEELRRIAHPWEAAATTVGIQKPNLIAWPLTFAHLCEMRQTINQFAKDGRSGDLLAVIEADAETYRAAVQKKHMEVKARGTDGKFCVTCAFLVTAAEAIKTRRGASQVEATASETRPKKRKRVEASPSKHALKRARMMQRNDYDQLSQLAFRRVAIRALGEVRAEGEEGNKQKIILPSATVDVLQHGLEAFLVRIANEAAGDMARAKPTPVLTLTVPILQNAEAASAEGNRNINNKVLEVRFHQTLQAVARDRALKSELARLTEGAIKRILLKGEVFMSSNGVKKGETKEEESVIWYVRAMLYEKSREAIKHAIVYTKHRGGRGKSLAVREDDIRRGMQLCLPSMLMYGAPSGQRPKRGFHAKA